MLRTLILDVECIKCNASYRLRIIDRDWDKWKDGMSVAESMPYIPLNARGIVETGVCGDCEDCKEDK